MRLNVLFFAAGIWLLQRQAELPDPVWTLLPIPLALIAWRLARVGTLTVSWPRAAGVRLTCLAAGFAWALACAHVKLADALPPAWEGRDIDIIGVVSGLPQFYERSVRFEFDVEHVLTAGATVPDRISLSWWARASREVAGAPPVVLHPGERLRFTVRLKRPHGFANPHGFDYEAWLLERGIRATGVVRNGQRHERLATMVYRPGYLVEVARDRLRARIQQALEGRPYAGVIVALAVGDQRAIPPDQWQVFTRTGVNHLMSISGLHVTMVSGLMFAIVAAGWRRSARLCRMLPAVKAATAAGLMAAFAYTLLAGFAVPAQRTLYMLCVVAAALWLGLGSSASVVLAAALLFVLLLDPWAVLAPGFWLSFGAVGIIFYASAGRLGQPHWLFTWVRVQWAVTLAMIPMLLALFQQVSLISPFANAFAIPLISLVVAPLTLLGMVLPVDVVLLAAHELMAWCMAGLDWASAAPDSVWEQHAPAAWAVVVASIGVACLLMPRGFPARWVGAVGFLPLFLTAPAPLPEQALRVTVLDVGQGLAVVAQTRNHALLYDTGPAFGPTADSGNRVIVPFLRGAGIRRLDTVIVSHDDNDHTGGALSVLQAVPVDRLLTSLPDGDPLLMLVDRAERCAAGQRWTWDGVAFEILHPSLESYGAMRMKDNDRSCVLKISTSDSSVLLPGDIEKQGEAWLVTTRRDALRSHVLVAPHQGSKTSSSAAFLDAVDPRVVVFPVGYRNRYGHPHADVVARYAERRATMARTDAHGAVELTFSSGSGYRMTGFRHQPRRYWHSVPHDAAPLALDELPVPGATLPKLK